MTDEFARAVCDIVRLIPAGRATSYGAIARAAGRPHNARLVGRIMSACTQPGIPTHRVVNAQGVLSASRASTKSLSIAAPDRMRESLEAEGIAVRNDRIVRWRELFWDPMEEIAR